MKPGGFFLYSPINMPKLTLIGANQILPTTVGFLSALKAVTCGKHQY